jgi:GT2 family glycosyltransferase
MNIAIVMPAINLWDKYSKDAIESVDTAMMRAKEHGIDSRLLFIDNASTDNTSEEAGKRVSTLFAHQRNERRWGFQESVNFGVHDGFQRGFEIVLVCNNDIVLHPDALWRLEERFKKQDVGMVTCMDVRGEMTEKGLRPMDIGMLLSVDKEVVEEAPHPNFSAFALTRECWDTVGEMDEVFAPAFHEDNDLHYRMITMGIPAIVYPPAMFYHYGSRTQNEANENGMPIVSSPMFEQNRARYIKKWGGDTGMEVYLHPYNDQTKSIRSTLQDPDREAA